MKTLGFHKIKKPSARYLVPLGRGSSLVEYQFPISKTSEIEVNVVEKSGGKINKNTQKVTWNLKLEWGEAKTIGSTLKLL